MTDTDQLFQEWERAADGAVIMVCDCGVQWVVGLHSHCLECHVSTPSEWYLDNHKCSWPKSWAGKVSDGVA